ncbi:MAG: T9SS type A sorting domain-containing protein [Saprospiraceae bacterium]
MKKLFLALMAWLCLAMASMNAQNDIEQQLLYILSEVDTEPVRNETGILTDRVPNYVPIQLFNGKNPNDSLYANREKFLLSYAMVNLSHVDQLPPFSQDSLMTRLEYYEGKPLMPLGLMVYRYQKIKESAVEDNLMKFDGVKFKVLIDPVSELFKTDTLFLMSCLLNQFTHGLEVPYILPDFFKLGNLGIHSLSIDFGDGNGFRIFNTPYVHRITYPESGQYALRFRMTLNTGEVLFSQSLIEVSDASSSNLFNKNDKDSGVRNDGYNSNPDGKNHFGGLIPGWKPRFDEYGNQIGVEPDYDNLVPGSGTFVHYWLNKNCEEPKIRKPLIIISGFDPGNNYGHDKVINGADGLLDVDYMMLDKRLKDLIHDGDYDIFFINYYNSTIDIRENAAYAKQAVDWINAQKRANGSSEKNIILGVSMGGLVSKWMLQEYENNREDHEAHLFMTFDSPMRGANIPLALQALPLRLGDRKVLGIPLRNIKDELKNAVKTLSSKAARQMLYYNLSISPEFYVSPEDLSTEHDAFFEELDSRGELKVPYVPFSNGAINGTGMLFSPVELIQDLEASIAISDELEIVIYTKGYSMSSNDMVIHSNTLSYDYYGAYIYKKEDLKITENFIPWDNAPGGLRSFEERKNGVLLNEQGFLYKSFCFIPTISALDLRGVADPFQTDLTDFENTINDFAPHISSYNGSIEASIQFEEDQTNQEHVSLNNRLATFLLGNLKTRDLFLTELSDRTFNFGVGKFTNDLTNGSPLSTSRIISNDLYVFNNGKLWINRNDRIAFTDEPNLMNTFPKEFEVSLGKTKCEAQPTELQVYDGGEVKIGDRTNQNTGILSIPDGTKLTLKENGKLHIFDESRIEIYEGGIMTLEKGSETFLENLAEIIVHSGGHLIIKNGAYLHLKGNSRINTEKDAEITIESGASIILEAPMKEDMNWKEIPQDAGSTILLQGTMNLPDGEIAIAGQGFVWILSESIISYPQEFLKFIGHGKTHTAFRFDSERTFDVISFSFDNAKCLMNHPFTVRNAEMVTIQNSYIYSIFMSLSPIIYIDNLLKRNNENIFALKNVQSTTVTNSFFDDFPISVDDFELFSSAGSEFITKYKPNNISLKSGTKSVFNNSSISTEKPFFTVIPQEYIKKIGISCERVLETRLNNCKLSNFNKENSRTFIPDPDNIFIGIKLEKSPYLYLNYSEINSSSVGVFSHDGANIVMNNSIIKDCKYGIQMNGASDIGMVKMICSSLENNFIGIFGQDIFLAIDGIINSQTTKNGYVTANYFDNIESHFSICYKNKNIVKNIIPARENTWVDSDKFSFTYCNGGGEYIELLQSPHSNGMCSRVELASCEDTSPTFPLLQPGNDPALYQGLCQTTTCQGLPILENYWKGFSCFYNDNLWNSHTFLQPLSEEGFVEGNENLSVFCKFILKEANAFVSGFYRFQFDSIQSSVLYVYPNCKKTSNNEYESTLVLNLPPWAIPNESFNWYASEGGKILSMSPDKLTITNNGTGKYAAFVTKDNCSYTGYYKYNEINQPPFLCPPDCSQKAPVLLLDDMNCYVYIQIDINVLNFFNMNTTFILQRFLNNGWVDVTNATSFQVTEDGTYRYVARVEGCEEVYSNFITTSCTSQCNCLSESLQYDSEDCALTWINYCNGFSVTLQKQNFEENWVDVVENPGSPFALQVDGTYRLVYEKEGCSALVSNVVSTNCALPGFCFCEAPVLNYNSQLCILSWNLTSCSGFATVLEKQTGGVWSQVSVQSPYNIPNNSNGSFRLVSKKTGCFPSISNHVLVQCSCSSPDRIILMNSGITGTDLFVEPYFTLTHMIPFSSNVCVLGRIEFLLSTQEVNQTWTIEAEGSNLTFDWSYTSAMAKVYAWLDEPVQSGETTVIFTSPCGDTYTVLFTFSCEAGCPNFEITYEGNTIESCDNLVLTVIGGSYPYTFSTIGEGSLGTIIQQDGNEVDLSSLLPAESITLQVLVTDLNGCSGIQNILYLRCATGCNGGQCGNNMVECENIILGGQNGYNSNAIINFVVQENIQNVSVFFEPYSRPQLFEVLLNGNVILYSPSIKNDASNLDCQGLNYFPFPNNTIIPISIGTLTKNHQKLRGDINSQVGDLITVRILNPEDCNQSNWKIQFVCSNQQSKSNQFVQIPTDEIQNKNEETSNVLTESDFQNSMLKVELYPNPTSTSSELIIASKINQAGEISIINQFGQNLFTKPIIILEGVNIQNLNELLDLPTGVYNVIIKTSTEISSHRIVKFE